MTETPYEIRSSTRRKRTMTAFREQGRVVVVVPAHMSAQQRRDLVPPLVERLLANEAGRRTPRGGADLTERVRRLYATYLRPAVGGAVPTLGARWVTNQEARWGSCTPLTGEIRLSHRLQEMPEWVVDYVCVHEAAHLLERHHNQRFHALVARFPEAQRAQAFLDGVDFARRHALPPVADDVQDDDVQDDDADDADGATESPVGDYLPGLWA